MKYLEKSHAMGLFEQYCQGYNQRDLSFLLSLFTKNCNLWGTALDEYRTGLKEIEDQHKRDWAQSEKGRIEIISFVPTNQSSVWAAATCNALITMDGQEHRFEHLRGTITLEKESGVWKISHMHVSFPDYRNSVNSSFPSSP